MKHFLIISKKTLRNLLFLSFLRRLFSFYPSKRLSLPKYLPLSKKTILFISSTPTKAKFR